MRPRRRRIRRREAAASGEPQQIIAEETKAAAEGILFALRVSRDHPAGRQLRRPLEAALGALKAAQRVNQQALKEDDGRGTSTASDSAG